MKKAQRLVRRIVYWLLLKLLQRPWFTSGLDRCGWSPEWLRRGDTYALHLSLRQALDRIAELERDRIMSSLPRFSDDGRLNRLDVLTDSFHRDKIFRAQYIVSDFDLREIRKAHTDVRFIVDYISTALSHEIAAALVSEGQKGTDPWIHLPTAREYPPSLTQTAKEETK